MLMSNGKNNRLTKEFVVWIQSNHQNRLTHTNSGIIKIRLAVNRRFIFNDLISIIKKEFRLTKINDLNTVVGFDIQIRLNH